MYFSLELDAQKIAALTSLNRNTVNRYLGLIRGRMAELCERQAQKRQYGVTALSDRREDRDSAYPRAPADECHPVFGIRSRNAHIYTKLFPNGVHRKLRRFLRSGADNPPLLVPEEWHHFDGVVDLNGRWHYRLSPVSPGVKAVEDIHDCIEAFLGFARKRLTAFTLNGNDHFNLYLKECEFRFNNRNENLYQLLLKRLREHPLT
jgi:hypothetical protein